MGSRNKRKNNVIAASFPNIVKEGGNQSGQSAIIVPFEKSRETMTDKSIEFQPEDYLDWLAEQKHINLFEETKLRAATAPLFRKYPKMTLATRNQVQDEFTGEKTPRFTVIADKEEAYWREALKNGREPLPGFDYAKARAIFTAPPEERTTRVSFFKPEYVTDVPVVDIRRELAKAAAFFHIILRMVRTQYEKDYPALRSLFDDLTDNPARGEAFSEEEKDYSALQSLFDDLTDKAMAEELRQSEEGYKHLRLRPRKPSLWRKLFDRFRKK